MAGVQSGWLWWGTLCSLLALLFAGHGLWDCPEKNDLLKDAPENVVVPSECMLSCTALTYRGISETQDKLTVRFRDSSIGELEEYCWPQKVQCSPGQQLQNAFILLPVDLSLINGETLSLKISLPDVAAETLYQHTAHSVLPSDCGLRYDVTQHLARKELQQALCVKVLLPKHAAVGEVLRCPPFLVTTWKHCNQGES